MRIFPNITLATQGNVEAQLKLRGHGGRVAWPQVGKLVVACHWLAVYSTEP